MKHKKRLLRRNASGAVVILKEVLIRVVVGRYLITVYLLAVYLAPGIDDVGKDEGNEERHPEHGVEGEITAA